MKPTQQEIIDLAREHATRYTNRHYPDKPVFTFTQDALQKVIELALERFGAGGGEPVAFMVETEVGVMVWPAKDHDEALTYCAQGDLPTNLYTHPSPTDLRAEYLRGLEDAAKVCDERAQGLLSIIDLPVVSSPIIQKDRAAQWKDAATKIRELKGKQ